MLNSSPNRKTVIVMVDEAQLLRLESLEAIRSLLNYETNTEKPCRVVLAVELELRDRLHTRRYRAFRSGIVAPVVLEYFSPEETQAMIGYRHEYWQVPNRFTEEACHRVHEKPAGVPRDTVLICGYAYSIADDRKRYQTCGLALVRASRREDIWHNVRRTWLRAS